MGNKNNNEKAASLSREVRKIIESEPYIRNPLAEGVINYSALARMIAPKVKEKLGREVKEESLIVAIKRFADEINGKTSKEDYEDIFKRSSLSMQDGVSCALLNSNSRVLGAIEDLLKNTDWHPGEVRIIIEGPGRVTVVLKGVRMNALMENVKEEIIDFTESNALITMRCPIESRHTYGVISEITSALSKKGISIEIVSAAPDLHLIVKEQHGEETYKSIKQIISSAKQGGQENSGK